MNQSTPVRRDQLDHERAVVGHPAKWIAGDGVDRDAFDVADLAGRGVADPELDAIRSRVQESEMFSVTAPVEARDLRAGRHIDLDFRAVGNSFECQADGVLKAMWRV